MRPNDIKPMQWYKIKNNIFYPNFYAKKIHPPKSVDKKINKFLVEGVHVSSHVQCLDFGLIKYIPATDLVKTDQPPNAPITGPVAGSGASSCWAASIEDKPIMLFQSELNKIIDEQEDQIRKLKSLLAEYDLTINDMRDENKIHGHITEASAYYLIKIKPVYLKLCPPNAPITGPQGSGASPCWAAVAESNPPIGIPVLVTDGEDVKLDHQCFHYEINGRILLPSDPRRATTTPERKFARFVGVTHWMHLPFPPNAPITGQPKAAPVHDLVGHEPEKD